MLPFTVRRSDRISYLEGKLHSDFMVQSYQRDPAQVGLVAKCMTHEPLRAGPLPLCLPLLWAQKPLCHSTLGSNAQVVTESHSDLDISAEFSPPPSVAFWTWQLLCLSGTLLVAFMGNWADHCLFDHPLGCFTDTLINMFQTEPLISPSVFHLKGFPFPVFFISVSVSTLLLKADAWETSLITSLFFSSHTTKFDGFYLQDLFPICSLLSLPSRLHCSRYSQVLPGLL